MGPYYVTHGIKFASKCKNGAAFLLRLLVTLTINGALILGEPILGHPIIGHE